MKRADVVFSGMRPTGRLHLGNYWGALKNWVSLQTRYSCFFSVVDWHMLTTGYDDTSKLQENCREMVLDWLAAGLDPAKCVIFKQSDVPEHAELALMLGMVTPLSWLENNPTWKEQLQELAKTKESMLRQQIAKVNDVGTKSIDWFYDIVARDLKKLNDIAPTLQLEHLFQLNISNSPYVTVDSLSQWMVSTAETVTTSAFNQPFDSNQVISIVSDFQQIPGNLRHQSVPVNEIRTRVASYFQEIRNEVVHSPSTSGPEQSLRTFGFLGYPVLQAADILLYHGTKVPVGQDQLPHVELSREIARKFNHVFGEIFAEPQPLLTPTPKVPGLDSRKMSKSYGNAIDIYETEKSLEKKIKAAYTDPNRKTATDPGHPLPCLENPPGCSVYAMHKLYADTDFYMKRGDECRAGQLGCGSCKKDLLNEMSGPFSEFRQRRESFTPAQVDAILMQGAEKARAVAKTTMVEVRRAMRLR